MTWIDIAVVAIIALSALFGLFRGFVREVLSLVVWVFSFWTASRYSDALAAYFGPIPHPDLRLAAAFLTLLLAALIAGFLVTAMAVRLIRASVLSGPDRTLGALFGLLRGVLVVTILAMVTAPMTQTRTWDESRFAGPFKILATWASTQLTGGIGDHPASTAGELG